MWKFCSCGDGGGGNGAGGDCEDDDGDINEHDKYGRVGGVGRREIDEENCTKLLHFFNGQCFNISREIVTIVQ